MAKERSSKVKLSLFENSAKFTAEAVRNAVEAGEKPDRWHFAILHLTQAVELFLKDVLASEHQSLIYINADNPDGDTISILKAVSRVEKYTTLALEKGDIGTLKGMVRMRDRIVHSSVEFDCRVGRAG